VAHCISTVRRLHQARRGESFRQPTPLYIRDHGLCPRAGCACDLGLRDVGGGGGGGGGGGWGTLREKNGGAGGKSVAYRSVQARS
jgi:hypothetical protein